MNDQAIRELDEAIRLNPEDAKVYINRTDAYDRKGKHVLAITDYTKAIRIYSKDPKVYTKRGFIYVKRGKYDLAITDYSEAIKIDPKCVETYRARGDVYLVKREYNLAFADYDEVKKINIVSGNTEVYEDKGDIDIYRGRLALDWGALADNTEYIWWKIRDLDKVIRRNPKNATAFNDRGDIYYYELHNLDEAFKDYNEAIRLKPDYATAYKNRGDLFQEIDVYDLAIEDYSKAIKFASDEADYYVYEQRGLMYIYEGAYDRAIADYNEAIKHLCKLEYSIDAYIYFRRGYAYYKKGDSDKAITDLSEAFQRNFNNHTMIYLYRGSMYFAIGNYDQALEDYDNVVRLCPNYKIDFLDDNFKKFRVQGEVAQATKLLDSVSDNYYQSGNDAAAAYYSGVSILFCGNKPKARRRFERARELGFEDDTKIAEHLENLKSRKQLLCS